MLLQQQNKPDLQCCPQGAGMVCSEPSTQWHSGGASFPLQHQASAGGQQSGQEACAPGPLSQTPQGLKKPPKPQTKNPQPSLVTLQALHLKKKNKRGKATHMKNTEGFHWGGREQRLASCPATERGNAAGGLWEWRGADPRPGSAGLAGSSPLHPSPAGSILPHLSGKT